MKKIMFTKFLKGMGLFELINTLKDMNLDGADLCVRPGYLVEPKNADKTLPRVVKEFENNGLIIPLITTPVDFINPTHPDVERVFAGCGESGVGLVKLGYWEMMKNGYWESVSKMKKDLKIFSKLAQKYKVKVLIHNHFGEVMGLNSCSAMHIVEDFSPEEVGIFIDPGHLSLVGEPFRMAFDIVKKYVSAVAIKDFIRERIKEGGKRTWYPKVVPLGEGFVNWEEVVKVLKENNFNGPISFHSEYEEYNIEQVILQTKLDLIFWKNLDERI